MKLFCLGVCQIARNFSREDSSRIPPQQEVDKNRSKRNNVPLHVLCQGVGHKGQPTVLQRAGTDNLEFVIYPSALVFKARSCCPYNQSSFSRKKIAANFPAIVIMIKATKGMEAPIRKKSRVLR